MSTALYPIPAGAQNGASSALTSPQPMNPMDTVDRPDVFPPAYLRMLPRWEKCRALMVGTEAIRAGAEDYLVRFENESDAAFDARTNLVALVNNFARTVLASVGMLLQSEPVLGEDMPSPIVALWENIDGAGMHGAVFSRHLVTAGLVDGLAGVLVEKSDARAADAAEELALGLRPYWILVHADNIIRAVYEPIGGQRTLVLLVIRETVEERVPESRFRTRTVYRYRVYSRTDTGTITASVWETTDAGSPPREVDAEIVLEGLTAIPWAPFVVGNEVRPGEVTPPLIDLADLNINHHNVNTNIQSLEALAMVPTPVRIGAQPDEDGDYPEITLGPRNTIEAPHVEGVNTPVYWLSPPVDVLDPAMKTLDKLEAAMAREGGAFLTPEPNAVESAEAKRIKGSAQRATLSTVARALTDCLETACAHTARYLKLAKSGTVTVNRDFEQTQLDASTMAVYVQAVRDAGLPVRILLEAWQQGGRISEDVDLAELEAEILANIAAAEQQRQLERATQLDAAQSAQQNSQPNDAQSSNAGAAVG